MPKIGFINFFFFFWEGGYICKVDPPLNTPLSIPLNFQAVKEKNKDKNLKLFFFHYIWIFCEAAKSYFLGGKGLANKKKTFFEALKTNSPKNVATKFEGGGTEVTKKNFFAASLSIWIYILW